MNAFNMNIGLKSFGILCALIFQGCSNSTENISATYVSPLKYDSYTCSQLTEEYARILAHSAATFQAQDDKADNDAVAMGVGLVLFWPALFFINTNDQEQEVAMLKGDLNALEQSSIKKDCSTLLDQIAEDKAKAEELRKQREAELAKQQCMNTVDGCSG